VRSGWLRGLTAAGLLLAAAGLAIRTTNAFRYPTVYGFDSPENWRYIERLTGSWALPAPDADWSTAHPPLFYYACAALCRALGRPEQQDAVILIRLVSSILGLFAVGLAVGLVRRADPENPGRALLAGALLLFLPAHIYMSAMLHEEILVSSLISLVAVAVACECMSPERPRRALRRAAGWGVAAGLALLTKLTGLLVVVAAAGAYAVDGWRRRDWALAAGRVGIFLGAALVVGGWYYARNRVEYGYFYPHHLETHRNIYYYPPGVRSLGDYLRFPFATLTEPVATSPALMRSIWGTTYSSVWYDSHRHFLPSQGGAVNLAGTLILILALLPTAAFLRGLARGLRRALESPRGPDLPLLLLVALTLAGYAAFTWRNPWFVVAKGSFLLGISVPFAFYASESLCLWARGSPIRARVVWICMGALFLAVAATFTQGVVFEKTDPPGFRFLAPVEEGPAG
jgi:hypothetical protein